MPRFRGLSRVDRTLVCVFVVAIISCSRNPTDTSTPHDVSPTDVVGLSPALTSLFSPRRDLDQLNSGPTTAAVSELLTGASRLTYSELQRNLPPGIDIRVIGDPAANQRVISAIKDLQSLRRSSDSVKKRAELR